MSSQTQLRTPSKIIELINAPYGCTEDQLVKLGKPFGEIVHTLTESTVGKDTKKAFIEFEEESGAIAMISHYESSSVKAKLGEVTVDLQYSDRKEIWNDKLTEDDVGKVIMVTVVGDPDDTIFVGIDLLRVLFSPFGFVRKIIRFEFDEDGRFQDFLVHYSRKESAAKAKHYLDGIRIPWRILPEGNGCFLKVKYPATDEKPYENRMEVDHVLSENASRCSLVENQFENRTEEDHVVERPNKMPRLV